MIGGDGPLEVAVSADQRRSRAPRARTRPSTLPSRRRRRHAGSRRRSDARAARFRRHAHGRGPPARTLTQPIATGATRVLKHGVASFDLAVAAGATPKAPADGVRVTGTLALTDLDVAGDNPKVFALRWKQLAVALGALTAPGCSRAHRHRRRRRSTSHSRASSYAPELTVTRPPRASHCRPRRDLAATGRRARASRAAPRRPLPPPPRPDAPSPRS